MPRCADCAVLRGGVGGRYRRVVAHRARGTGDRWKVKAANPSTIAPWTMVATPAQGGWRFFKVGVEMR